MGFFCVCVSGILWENDHKEKWWVDKSVMKIIGIFILFYNFPFFPLPLVPEPGDQPKERLVVHHVEGRPGALLHVCLLLQCPQPSGDPEWREAHGGAERTLCVQVWEIYMRWHSAGLEHVQLLLLCICISVHFVLKPVKVLQNAFSCHLLSLAVLITLSYRSPHLKNFWCFDPHLEFAFTIFFFTFAHTGRSLLIRWSGAASLREIGSVLGTLCALKTICGSVFMSAFELLSSNSVGSFQDFVT